MGKKILIIDEEPHILIIAANRLRANGYEVITALSCVQGLKRIKEERPDMILLDCMVTEMSGEEMLHRLKNDPDTKTLPIVVLTTDVGKLKVTEYQLRGAATVIFKPFTPESLLHAVEKAVH